MHNGHSDKTCTFYMKSRIQHKAYFLIQFNADSLYPLLADPYARLLAYPDADYPDAVPD